MENYFFCASPVICAIDEHDSKWKFSNELLAEKVKQKF